MAGDSRVRRLARPITAPVTVPGWIVNKAYRWPAALRVSPIKSATGVWEMTWSFASRDGPATFEFVRDGQGLIVRWRRVGDHGIHRKP